jgi:hypothetical protein
MHLESALDRMLASDVTSSVSPLRLEVARRRCFRMPSALLWIGMIGAPLGAAGWWIWQRAPARDGDGERAPRALRGMWLCVGRRARHE